MDLLPASTQDRVRAAAREAFAHRGYARASVHEIAAAAGVTTGALYHHFGSKRGILSDVRSAESARLQACMASAAAHAAPGARAVAAALLAAWDQVRADGLERMYAEDLDEAVGDELERSLQGLWPWAPESLASILLATWRGALRHAVLHPGGDARLVLEGILVGLAG